MAFKKPQQLVNGTKILIYGEAGTRKSRTALTFPNIAYIDTDQSADNYLEEFADNIEMYSDSTTFAEVMDDLDEIEGNDDVKTIVLDSDTKVYENQQHTALRVVEQRAIKAGRLKEGEGLSPKEWAVLKLNHNKMLSKLFENKKDGKTIIVICEGKDEKEAFTDSNNQTSFKTVGIKPNSDKGIEFDFDIVLEMVRDKKTGETIGAKVVKDRTGTIPEGEIVENPAYDTWAEAIEKKRKGTVKADKRNFEKDLEKDEKAFGVTSEGIIANEIDDIKDQIKNVLVGMEQDVKVKKVSPKFKELLGVADFTKVNDVDKLKEALKFVKSV